MEYHKAIPVSDPQLLAKLKEALPSKGFRITRETDQSVQAERGSRWAQFYTGDIRKYATTFEATVDQTVQILTVHYDIDTGAGVPTPGDQRTLDAEVQALVGGAATGGALPAAQVELGVSPFAGFTEKGALSLVAMALLSFFIFPYLGFLATVGGIVSLYAAIRYKLGWKIALLNLLAIILGSVAFVLSKAAHHPRLLQH